MNRISRVYPNVNARGDAIAQVGRGYCRLTPNMIAEQRNPMIVNVQLMEIGEFLDIVSLISGTV